MKKKQESDKKTKESPPAAKKEGNKKRRAMCPPLAFSRMNYLRWKMRLKIIMTMTAPTTDCTILPTVPDNEMPSFGNSQEPRSPPRIPKIAFPIRPDPPSPTRAPAIPPSELPPPTPIGLEVGASCFIGRRLISNRSCLISRCCCLHRPLSEPVRAANYVRAVPALLSKTACIKPTVTF